MKLVRIFIFILIAFLLYWFFYFLKTGDLFFEDAYISKERAFQAWLKESSQLEQEFLAHAKKIEPNDQKLLFLAGEDHVYQLRFNKEFFLWTIASISRIDDDTIKRMNEDLLEYDFRFECVATVITNNPDIIKVNIGKKEAEMLPLAPYFKKAKEMKLWFLYTQPDAFDCQGPSGATFTFYDYNGKIIEMIEDW